MSNPATIIPSRPRPKSSSPHNYTAIKIGPLVKRPGGKAYLARRLIDLLPSRSSVYVEPYLGGGSVFLNLHTDCYKEAVINDLDPRLMSIWWAAKDLAPELLSRVEKIAYTEENFENAKLATADNPPHLDAEYASWMYARCRMSRGAMGESFAWSDRLRGGQPGDVNAWINSFQNLRLIAEKLRAKPTTIYNVTAIEIIERHIDDPDATMYIDCPYLHATRTSTNLYDFEMGYEDHEELLKTIKQIRGRFMISGYSHPLYEEALLGCDRQTFDLPNHSSQESTKQRRTEVIWTNYTN